MELDVKAQLTEILADPENGVRAVASILSLFGFGSSNQPIADRITNARVAIAEHFDMSKDEELRLMLVEAVYRLDPKSAIPFIFSFLLNFRDSEPEKLNIAAELLAKHPSIKEDDFYISAITLLASSCIDSQVELKQQPAMAKFLGEVCPDGTVKKIASFLENSVKLEFIDALRKAGSEDPELTIIALKDARKRTFVSDLKTKIGEAIDEIVASSCPDIHFATSTGLQTKLASQLKQNGTGERIAERLTYLVSREKLSGSRELARMAAERMGKNDSGLWRTAFRAAQKIKA